MIYDNLFQNKEGELEMVYKRVAVVEQFFSIIYSVHVESSGETPHLRGRAGKHCGQKRTYRAVSHNLRAARVSGLLQQFIGLNKIGGFTHVT